MPKIKSAKKRVNLNALSREANKAKRSNLRTAIKKVTSAVDAANENAGALYGPMVKKLDQAAASRLIHKNKAARTKSRLARKINAMAKTGSEEA